MALRDDIINRLAALKSDLDGYGVRRISLFGSAARGDERGDSDIDLLVEFSRPVGLFHFVRLQRFLSDKLGRKIDLVTSAALRPGMRETVLKEAIHAA